MEKRLSRNKNLPFSEIPFAHGRGDFFVGQEPTEGSFCGEKLQDKLFCGGGVRGGFVAAGRIIPIKFIGIIDKGYSYSYNR